MQTAQIGPLQLLERRILENNTKIEAWFRERWQETPPVMYGSVDLRNAGFKLAPVDMNLYPAGFNNPTKTSFLWQYKQLKPCWYTIYLAAKHSDYSKVAHAIRCIGKMYPPLQKYFDSNGFDVRIGGLPDTFSDVTKMTTPSGKTVTITHLLRREGNHLYF